MKTTMKKFMASIAALTMSAAIVAPAMSAFAADPGTITITDSTGVSAVDKTINAYRLFSLTTETQGEKTVYIYTVTPEWFDFMVAYYNANRGTGAEIVIPTENADESSGPIVTEANVAAAKAKANVTLTDWIAALGEDSAALRKLAQAAQAEVVNKEYNTTGYSTSTLTQEEKTGTSVKYSLEEDGYYLFVDATGEYDESARSAPILKTIQADKNTSVIIKADAPKIQKKIWEDTNGDEEVTDDELVDANTAIIGEKVKYQINADIPDTTYYTHYTYVITDIHAEGLKLDLTTEAYGPGEKPQYNGYKKVTGGIKVSVDGCDGEEGKEPGHGDHNLRYQAYYNEDARTLKIIFNSLDMQKLGDSDGEEGWGHTSEDIIVKYSAIVQEGAVINGEGNENKVNLTYSNDPSASGQGYKGDNDHDGDVDGDDPENPPETPDEPESPDTPGEPDDDDETETSKDDEVRTYLTEVTLNKFENIIDDSKRLAGAVFKIECIDKYGDEATPATLYVKNMGGNKWIVSKDKDFLNVENNPVSVTTTADGKIIFSGLAEGKYRITEVSAPEGFNGLDEAIEFELKCKVNNKDLDKVDYDQDEADVKTCVWTMTINDGGLPDNVTQQGNSFEFDVINKKGSLFPSTGGIGTTIFYTTGIAMLIGAGALVIVKRRSSER